MKIFQQERNLSAGARVFVWVGTLMRGYDPETALRTAELVRKKREDIMFDFSGESPSQERRGGNSAIKI